MSRILMVKDPVHQTQALRETRTLHEVERVIVDRIQKHWEEKADLGIFAHFNMTHKARRAIISLTPHK